MNWAKENKFLTGFIVVMVIGVGFLGFKVFSASSRLEEADSGFDTKATAYNRLRRLDPFPNRQNLQAFEEQKAEAAQAIQAFQTELAKREFPIEPMSPEQFQDELKKAVTEIRAKATAANVVLPKDKFYLGFDPYETAPPSAEAAPALGRQLKAIEWVMQQIIAARVTELKELKREPLPEEQGRGGTAGGRQADRRASRPPAGRDRAGDRPGQAGGKQDLVTAHSFDVVFTGKQHQFSSILNAIVSPKAPQFYITRGIRVTNQNLEGPPRVSPDAPPPVDPAAAPADPNAPPAAAPTEVPAPTAVGDIKYIVGEELVEVALKLEIVDFADVAAPK